MGLQYDGETLKLIAAYIEEDKMYFSAWNKNGFFCHNLNSGETRLLTLLPIFEGLYGYGDFCRVENKIYLSPCGGASIVEIYIDDWTYKEYPIEDDKLGISYARCATLYPIDEYIYICPYHAHAIMRFHMESHEIDYFTECYDIVNKKKKLEIGPLFGGGILVNHRIWICCLQSMDLLAYDPSTKKIINYTISEYKERIQSICHDGKDFWIYTDHGDLIKWNEREEILHRYEHILQKDADGSSMCYYNNSIWIASRCLTNIVSIDVLTGEVKREQFNRIIEEQEGFGSLKVINQELYYLPNQNDLFYKIDVRTRSIEGRRIELSGDNYVYYMHKYINCMAKKSIIMKEGSKEKFGSYIKGVCLNEYENHIENNKRLYVIFTADIHSVGGMQMYVSGIAEYLKRHGFDVVVFFSGDSFGTCEISDLTPYVYGGNYFFSIEPALLTEDQLDQIYQYSIRKAEIIPENYSDIYIESQADIDSLWAEYFAERLHGKHIIQLLNEFFHSADQRYIEYEDFFWGMYENARLRGDVKKLFSHLIDKNLVDGSKTWCKERYPLDDIENPLLDKVRPADWNIAYIGRGNKEYVPTIIKELGVFAKKHSDKEILFIFVGDFTVQEKNICRQLCTLHNVKVMLMGNLVPIPKKLFQKIDAVIANSQTSYFSALEGKPVIVVDSVDFLSCGVLGYNCSYFGGGNHRDLVSEDIHKTLEDVFVTKGYQKYEFKLPEMEHDDVYSLAIDAFEELPSTDKYYNVGHHIYKKQPVYQLEFLKKIKNEYEKWSFDLTKLKGASIAVFGAGYEGTNCINWLEEHGYSITLVVDNDYGKWNTYLGNYLITAPDQINHHQIDFFLVCCLDHAESIVNQLENEYGIRKECCTTYSYLRYFDFAKILL